MKGAVGKAVDGENVQPAAGQNILQLGEGAGRGQVLRGGGGKPQADAEILLRT